jgi:hypothetical protein
MKEKKGSTHPTLVSTQVQVTYCMRVIKGRVWELGENVIVPNKRQ